MQREDLNNFVEQILDKRLNLQHLIWQGKIDDIDEDAGMISSSDSLGFIISFPCRHVLNPPWPRSNDAE